MACTVSKPWRSSPSKDVDIYSIVCSARFPTVRCFTFNFISHVVHGSQAAGPDPPMALWNRMHRQKVPFTRKGARGDSFIILRVLLHPLPAGLLERIILNSRLSSLCQEGCYKNQSSPLSMGLLMKSIHFPPPSEKQAKQGLYLQRLNIPLIGLLAFKPGALSPASLSLSSIPEKCLREMPREDFILMKKR